MLLKSCPRSIFLKFGICARWLHFTLLEAFIPIVLNLNLSLNQTPDIFALCETNLGDSINSGNFSVKGYLTLIQKHSSTHMHSPAVYVKEGLPFAWDISLEISADSYFCFRLALLHSVFYLFFFYQSPLSLCTVFYSISSNIDELL